MLTVRQAHNLQRVGFLALVPTLLLELAVDPREVLKKAGVPATALDSPDSTIPYTGMGKLLQVCADATRCPHFGLLISARIKLAALGLMGDLMRNAPTLRSALRDFTRHHHRNTQGAVGYLIEKDVSAYFGYSIYQPRLAGYKVILDGAVVAAHNLVRELVQPRKDFVQEVLLSHTDPPDLAPYRKVFGEKLRFNAGQSAIVFPRKLLDEPLSGADPVKRLALENRLREISYSGDNDTEAQLRREIKIALLRGSFSADEIASHIGISRRTLHRRLESVGQQYQQVLDEVRCGYTQQLLANTTLPVVEIAHLAGYADTSVLTRNFARWTGLTPSAWRVSEARASQ